MPTMTLRERARALLGVTRPSPVAASPRPNNPDAHLTTDAGPAMRGIEARGTSAEWDPTVPDTLPRAMPRAFRAPAFNRSATNDDVHLGTPREVAAAAHLTGGQPDARRTQTAPRGDTAAPADPFAPLPIRPTNTRDAVVIAPEAPPVRARQGFTGADPARVAQHQVAYTVRPFDQGIAQHPGPVTKAPQDNPRASVPSAKRPLTSGRPSPAGRTGTGMLPTSGTSRARTRHVPGAWDAAPAAPAVTTPGNYRAKGWRA